MIDAESYGVSGRQLLSSKHVPASGRVCSWRKPRVWPSSWAMMLPGVHEPLLINEAAWTSVLSAPKRSLTQYVSAPAWPGDHTSSAPPTVLTTSEVEPESCFRTI